MEDGKMSFRTKLLLGGIGGSFALMIIFIVVIIATLMVLGIIDVEGLNSSSSGLAYSDISSSNSFWWPIGSAETETDGGVLFARGDPVESTISSYFGPRDDPMGSGATYDHGALDISAPGYDFNQVNIIAAKDGKVIYPYADSVTNCGTSTKDSGDHDCGEGYGNYVMIEHDDGTVTLYGHMYANSITVKAGDTVKQGQVIGKMGSSGNSTGMHLHFEVRVNSERVDPLNYVDIDNPRPEPSKIQYTEGDTNKQSICLTLLKSYSVNGTAAILTNMKHESDFNPSSIGDYGTSYGLCQWHDTSPGEGRWTNLKNSFPNNYTTIEGQLMFLDYELREGYSTLRNNLISGTSSAGQLAYDYCYNFEVPANRASECASRQNSSGEYLTYVQNGCK